MSDTDLNELERAALDQIVLQHPSEAEVIRTMFEASVATKRENTGGGFFTTLEVPDPQPPRIESWSPLGDAYFKIEGMAVGICCMAHLESGVPALLEGYALANESTAEIDFANVRFALWLDFPEP